MTCLGLGRALPRMLLLLSVFALAGGQIAHSGSGGYGGGGGTPPKPKPDSSPKPKPKPKPAATTTERPIPLPDRATVATPIEIREVTPFPVSTMGPELYTDSTIQLSATLKPFLTKLPREVDPNYPGRLFVDDPALIDAFETLFEIEFDPKSATIRDVLAQESKEVSFTHWKEGVIERGIYWAGSALSSLEGIQECTYLRRLDLVDSPLKEISAIAWLQYLEVLDITWTVPRLEGLVRLVEEHPQPIPREEWEAIKYLPNLREIRTEGSPYAPPPEFWQKTWTWTFDAGVSPSTSTDALPQVAVGDIPVLGGTVVAHHPVWGDSLPFRFEFPLIPNPNVSRIQDAALLHTVTQSLGLSEGARLTRTELEAVTSLHCESASRPQIASLQGLEHCSGLRQLALPGQAIVDLSPIRSAHQLVELHLPDNQIADLTPLSGLTALEALDLSNNRIVDLTPLSGCTNLRDLTLSGNAGIANLAALKNLPLQRLVLRGSGLLDCNSLSGASTPLQTLDLSQSGKLGDVAGLTALGSLQELVLSGASGVNSIASLQSLPALRRLHLEQTGVQDLCALLSFPALEFVAAEGVALTEESYACAGQLNALLADVDILRPPVLWNAGAGLPRDWAMVSENGQVALVVLGRGNTLRWFALDPFAQTVAPVAGSTGLSTVGGELRGMGMYPDGSLLVAGDTEGMLHLWRRPVGGWLAPSEPGIAKPLKSTQGRVSANGLCGIERLVMGPPVEPLVWVVLPLVSQSPEVWAHPLGNDWPQEKGSLARTLKGASEPLKGPGIVSPDLRAFVAMRNSQELLVLALQGKELVQSIPLLPEATMAQIPAFEIYRGGTAWLLMGGREVVALPPVAGGTDCSLGWSTSAVALNEGALESPLTALAVSPDGQWVVAGTANGALALWACGSANPAQWTRVQLEGPTWNLDGMVAGLKFVPDHSELLVAALTSGEMALLDVGQVMGGK